MANITAPGRSVVPPTPELRWGVLEAALHRDLLRKVLKA